MGLEPTPCCQDGILNPARLPFRHSGLKGSHRIGNMNFRVKRNSSHCLLLLKKGLWIQKDDVFGQGDDVAAGGAEDLADLGGMLAGELAKFGGGEAGDGLGGIVKQDNRAGFEGAIDGGDTLGQEAFVLLEGGQGAFVDADGAFGAAVEDPSLAVAELGFGKKEGADFFAGEDAAKDVGFLAMGQDDAAAGRGGDEGGLNLGFHAAGGVDGALGAGGFDDRVGDFLDDADRQCVSMLAGVFVVEGVDVGQEDQQVSIDFAGDEGAELVVIAEGGSDLGGRDAVVFVEDGHDPQVQQGLDGVAEIEVALSLAEDLAGQQDLGDGEPELAEGLVVFVHEQGLADGGAGLAELEVGDGALELEGAGSHADGTAGDKENLSVFPVQGGDLRGDVADVLRVHAAVPAEGGGTDLDDDALDVFKVSHGTFYQTLLMRLWVKALACLPV